MKIVVTFISILLIYLLLAGFYVDELILGSVISAVLTGILVKTVAYEIDGTIFINLVKFIVLYIPIFVIQLILANLDIAKRVLSPKIPLNPGIVKVPTKIKSDLGKLTLANSITLTPGTLSLDVDKDVVFVHTVEVKGDNAEAKQKNISDPFEHILGGIFK